MIWWLDDPERLRAERQSVADLANDAGWLSGVRWYLANTGAMTIDFDIMHDGQLFPLRLTFSGFHPNSPPMVVPRDGCRLSPHQYGEGGNLCLEYRADNWQTAVTAAMMLESAHRLIEGERSEGGEEVISAHRVSVGQSVRGTVFRFLVSDAALFQLVAMNPGESLEIGIAEKSYGGTVTTTVSEISGASDSRAWPAKIMETTKRGYAVRLPQGAAAPSATEASIAELLDSLGLKAIREFALTPGPDLDLVVVADGGVTHFQAYDGNKGRIYIRSRTIFPDESKRRVPDEYTKLSEKTVGIVGCGSLGSKIAASLARSGVRHFRLIDDDLFFSENLVRNELSAMAVGVHKVDALRQRLTYIAGDVDISVHRMALGGQESAASTDTVMSELEKCDVIVDATADPHCFNFCAAVAKAGQKPLIWGEVFAGGIGGLVSRVRPGFEPEPLIARNQLNDWCNSHGKEAPTTGLGRYDGDAGGTPLFADDAEVSIIASHMARFVVDVLVDPENSAFPYPAYAVGLRQLWIFSEPMETWPIRLTDAEPWVTPADSTVHEDRLEILREFLPTLVDAENRSPE